jgi:hypothetical protein
VIVPQGDADALARGLLRISDATDGDRVAMARASRSLGRQFTPDRWATHLLTRVHELRELVGLPPALPRAAAGRVTAGG